MRSALRRTSALVQVAREGCDATRLRLNTGVMTSEVTFARATLTLRPPRVAILFPDDHRWRDWVVRALEVASEHWGGAGFILVPHDPETGEPSPLFAEIVRTYDPDHVVALQVRVADFEDWYPGSIRVSGVNTEEERAELIRNIHDELSAATSERARNIVASWCSPMRSARLLKERPLRERESQTTIKAVDRSDRFRRGLPAVPPLQVAVFAASSEWRTDLGLFSAARAGVVSDVSQPRPEPGLEVIDWGIRRDGAGPADLMYSPHPAIKATEAPTVFGSHPGLIQVSRRHVRDLAAVVVGDTGTDFALALAYDRILGRGHWVTPSMLDDPDILWRLRSSLWWVIADLQQHASFLCVSSSSLDDGVLSEAAVALQEPNNELQRAGRVRARVDESETMQVRPPRLEQGYVELAVDEHAGSGTAIPMSVGDDGTLEALSALDAPVPSDLMYSVASGKVPYWYVDAFFPQDASPRARDLPGSALLAVTEEGFPEVTVRASKEGVSYNPASLGFVSGGSLLPGRLGRPRLRFLSMRAWIKAMANATELGVRLSPPGRQAELISRRLGSRNALLDLISSGNIHALRAFVPLEKVPKSREFGTTVIGLDPYLSFEALTACTGSREDARELIDTLTAARLMRRGLTLGCEECGRLSFVDADRIGHEYECPQCGAQNMLTQARWREGDEPRWHYDLYTPLRTLLQTNGDIPLLASAHLRAKARSYSDAPELEFFDLDSGTAVAEVDVIASVDNKVVLVEAKAPGAFPNKTRGRQTGKLLRIADVLRADEIILATSKPAWNAEDVRHLEREARAVKPFALAVSVLTDLRAD